MNSRKEHRWPRVCRRLRKTALCWYTASALAAGAALVAAVPVHGEGQTPTQVQRMPTRPRETLKGEAPSYQRDPGSNPNATPPQRCFDSAGNTSCFGIPPDMTGNKLRGAALFMSSCSRCHGAVLASDYSEVNSVMKLREMRQISLSPQERADITAYVNRDTP